MTTEQKKTLLAHEESSLAYWLKKLEEAQREVEIWKQRVAETRDLMQPEHP